MKLLKYKDYFGSVDASSEDGCLFGKLEFVSALVNYEADTVPELLKAFHEAVDDYLAMCKERGWEPEKPFKGSFNVRVGHEVHARAAVAARAQGISLNEFAKRAIQRLVDEPTHA
jgi:predicted HicB family RNase H-like nuclease